MLVDMCVLKYTFQNFTIEYLSLFPTSFKNLDPLNDLTNPIHCRVLLTC